MKRDPRLHGLSSDHHHALVLAMRARKAAEEGEAPAPVWDEIRGRFERELAPHFRVEEEILLPALRGVVEQPGGAEMADRIAADHAELRALIDAATDLARFGTVLHDHVRYEERTVFEFAEEHVPSEVLDRIGEARPKLPPGCAVPESG